MGLLKARASHAARAALDLILPPLCPITGERVAAPGLLSAKGWASLSFIDDPVCARCGAPFAHEEGVGAICAACAADPPAFDRARGAVLYDDASHKLVVAFKHSDRTELAPLLTGWLVRAGAPLLAADSCVVPCPLHPFRLMSRRYNQAAMLASGFAKATRMRFAPEALCRVKHTPPQKALSADARRRNVAGAFLVRDDKRAVIEGRPVILVDDVMTTGATLSACARALKKAGASRVVALVVARVLRSGAAALG